MALLVGGALGLLSIAVAVYPFLKARWGGQPEASSETQSPAASELDSTLASIYEAIRTLRLEHELGKIPEGLYREQLRDYRLKAAAVLRQQMEAQTRDPVWLLEQEVLVARAALRTTEDGSPGGPAVNGVPRATVCPTCGNASGSADGQCPRCNAGPEPVESAPDGAPER